MRSFHPVGFRAMARASAEDLCDALPGVAVPTLLIYGDHDVWAPLAVADHLHEAIAGPKLVVLPGGLSNACVSNHAPARRGSRGDENGGAVR
jgi:pimeloyl-ACP methyl ester carboxylesterase